MKQSLQILYEDSHIIVCYKPHGIPTQSCKPSQPDMEHMILNHLAASVRRRFAQTACRPYLAVIHRLDQPVSGILVFAKTPHAAKTLSKQLSSHQFGKHYLALVDGIPKEKQGTLTDYIVKDGRANTSHICNKDALGAKQARLSYRVLTDTDPLYTQYIHIFPCVHGADTADNFRKGTLLEVALDTGRHHQIRVQLAHIGCPIMGDTKYNPNADIPHGPQALRLCAYKLTFRHPATGKIMKFTIDDVKE